MNNLAAEDIVYLSAVQATWLSVFIQEITSLSCLSWGYSAGGRGVAVAGWNG